MHAKYAYSTPYSTSYFHLIRKWEYEPSCKIKWLRRFHQFCNFLDQKMSLLTLMTINKSYVHHWTNLIKTLHFSTHMTIFRVITFFIKEVAKLVGVQNFCENRLNHLILHEGWYTQFRIRWIFRNLKIFGLFGGVSNEKLNVTHPGKNWKEWTISYQKILWKDVSSFSRNF